MCGFIGWVDFNRDLRTQYDVIYCMTRTMENRGPDAEGIFIAENVALGHRRLSIIDLEGGKQPMIVDTPSGQVALVYAGEVYNFKELRAELEGLNVSFLTNSDTEVVLQAFIIWGSRFAERLNGMFAFAIWDGRVQRLILGRDRLGVKPLYYFEFPDGILFSSEPKGIMANPLFEARLDLSAIPIILQSRLALPGETPLIGLKEVRPAHLLSFSCTGAWQQRYWTLESRPHLRSFEETVGDVRDLLEDIVRRQLVADVPRAAMLSGGIDSTSVAALAVKMLGRELPPRTLNTFCVQFESDRAHFVPTELRPEIDAPYAELAAAYIGSHHMTVSASTRDVIDAIPNCRRARDLPGLGQFDSSMYLLFQELRKNCTVALSGEAADEIFGGYPWFFRDDLIRRDHFPWMGDSPKLSSCLAPDLLKRINPVQDERDRYLCMMTDVPRLSGEDLGNARMREVLYMSMAGPLALLLDRKDRVSMCQGLEVRVPFCDHRLVEYMWNVPWSMKSRGGMKGLLKEAMRDLVPQETISRKKSGYPGLQDPNADKSIIAEALWLTSDSQSPIAGVFDAERLENLISQTGKSLTWVNVAHMLIPLIEMGHWITDHRISMR